ncbi:MAG: bifunctional UDP-sugar hydrolase/5'-nucleotidase, partial [Anaerovoracaceae bacterium]
AADAFAATEAEGMETITIVHSNDTHGRYQYSEDSRGKGNGILGFDRLKTVATDVGADLILDGGDTFHGLSFATMTKGMSTAKVMNAVGYTAMTPGNHDFNYGMSYLKDTLGTSFAGNILSCNILDKQGKKVFDPSMVKTITRGEKTIKVGIVGVTSPDLYNQSMDGYAIEDPVDSKGEGPLNTEVRRLKEIEDCSVIIVLSHMGNSSQQKWKSEELAKKVSGIDLIIDGHTHVKETRLVEHPDGSKTLIAQTGSFFDNIGVVPLTIDTTGSPYKVVGLEESAETFVPAAEAKLIPPDKEVAEAIRAEEEEVNKKGAEVIGQSPEAVNYSWEELRIQQMKLGNVVADSYIAATGADVAFENAGGIRGGIPQGEITAKNIVDISPFGNYVVTKNLTGKNILELIEQSMTRQLNNKKANDEKLDWPGDSGAALQWSGIYVEYDLSRPEGSRVVGAKIGDKALEKERIYRVAMNQYVAGDSRNYPEFLSKAEVIRDYGTCEEILRQYVSNGYPGRTWTDSLKKEYFTVYTPAPTPGPGETPEVKPSPEPPGNLVSDLEKGKVVASGDLFNPMVWIILLVVAAGVIVGIVAYGINQKKKGK